MLKILCVGNQWRGSDDGSLFKAFSRLGHLIVTVDYMNFLPSYLNSFIAKAISKLSSGFFIREYNHYLIRQFKIFLPDLVVVYKGPYVFEETIQKIKTYGVPVVNVYPDVSMFAHGPNIPNCMPLYDHIFTTKSFGAGDIERSFGIKNVSYVLHAFDPEIHRRLNIKSSQFPNLANDVSFIGTRSNKKVYILNSISKSMPSVDLKIWGSYWDICQEPALQRAIQHSVVIGDLYAASILLSKINLGILSEQVAGASAGDNITARTFHIPGTGGFMIHERTEELLEYFKEGVDIVTFEGTDELTEKIKYYLKNEGERTKIADQSHNMVWKYHRVDNRAQFILDKLKANGIIGNSST